MFRVATLLISVLLTDPACAASEDVILRKAIEAYQISALTPSTPDIGPKERLGQGLFFDPFISGPKRIACAACHVRSLGAGDALPMAVGLGGSKGVGDERLAEKRAFIIPRNALPFFNRGSDGLTALFWDGRVQVGPDGTFETPLGNRLPGGFDSLLAVAAVFPPAEPDEMLGRSMERVGEVAYHQDLVQSDSIADNLQERTLVVFERLLVRLLAPGEVKPTSSTVSRYRALFTEAYPGVRVDEFGIAHVGNALAAYIKAAFALAPAPWDRYISGDREALTLEQKQGALIFFGKGRCVVCHSGTHFSDSRFHSLALPQSRIGKHTSYIDYGRAGATSRGEDRFLFRTPPLRNVTKTGPYGHNGLFKTIEKIIEHHSNPVPALFETQQQFPKSSSYAGRLLASRSTILGEMAPLSESDISLLTRFLAALSSQTILSDDVALPTSVPSGDAQFVRR